MAETKFYTKEEIEQMGTENIAIGINAFYQGTTANRCICLGHNAGDWIINEDYQFCFAVSNEKTTEFTTKMTEHEWHVIHNVVKRAIAEGNKRKA